MPAKFLLSVLLALLCFGYSLAAHKCIHITGKVICRSNPDLIDSTEIAVHDKDAFIFDGLDRDDLMAWGHAESDGSFDVEGCGGDVDWLAPLLGGHNWPEPQWSIFHFCNSDRGEEIRGREFRVFKPNRLDLGTIVLDDF